MKRIIVFKIKGNHREIRSSDAYHTLTLFAKAVGARLLELTSRGHRVSIHEERE